ncbi:MAG: hypothetical protein DWQ37_03415 [Planctomycetota bacterium]|nr:MAG: hypothetical protein DWQ37_03415 [Planctomycetota bacterium]
MDALAARCAILIVALGSLGASYSLGASHRTPNFIVEAPTAEMAAQIGKAAEKYRRELAIEWTGSEMRNWAQPCTMKAHVGNHLGAGGATSFEFHNGEVFGWRMTIQGSLERILDSVLPHEVNHTIFATHFRQPLPRWADEGACTTVEHESERVKQQKMLIEFLHTGRGISFSRMFAMREYPHDVMPLYSQGYSLARYLLQQGGKRKFLEYLADGLGDNNWARATKDHYGYDDLLALQNTWLEWVREGSPAISTPVASPALVAVNEPQKQRARPKANLIYRDPADPANNGARLAARGADGPSVYDIAAQEAGSNSATPGPQEAVDAAWQPRRRARQVAAVEPTQSAPRDAEMQLPHPAHQVTRPQEFERPRQVILEWSRPRPNQSAQARQLPGPL